MKTNLHLTTIFLILLPLIGYSQIASFTQSSDSTAIYFRTFGEGKPLLIINGGPGMNSNGFENLAQQLSTRNTTIIYDQRGTGKSKLNVLDTITLTMKLMMDDMEAIRKALKIEKWAILGHSFGGILASYYATQYPEHVEKIVLSASGGIDLDLLTYVGAAINAKLSKDELATMNEWTAKISAGDTSHFARLQRGKALAPAYLYDRKYIPLLAERLTQGNGVINQLMWDNLRKIQYDCSKNLQGFNKPVLIIQGKEDIIKAETAEKAHKVFSNSKIVFMEHCGHYGWLDNPEIYFQEVSNFLLADQ